jgi:hypothetical protein
MDFSCGIGGGFGEDGIVWLGGCVLYKDADQGMIGGGGFVLILTLAHIDLLDDNVVSSIKHDHICLHIFHPTKG